MSEGDVEEGWYSHGPKGNKREAQRFESWMHRGGFKTRLKKVGKVWHVESWTGTDEGLKAYHAEHSALADKMTGTGGSEAKTPAADMIGYGGRTDRTEAKHALGASGGVSGPRSDHPFGRWLEKHERRKEAMLTVPVTPKQPRKEGPHNKLAEEMADQELAESRAEQARTNYTVSGTLNPDTKESMREDARKHLIFRKHSYLPTMGRHLEPGAYGKSPYEGGGLSNMANDPNVRN